MKTELISLRALINRLAGRADNAKIVRPTPRKSAPPCATFSHFATEAEWEAHRKQVAEAQKNGSPF